MAEKTQISLEERQLKESYIKIKTHFAQREYKLDERVREYCEGNPSNEAGTMKNAVENCFTLQNAIQNATERFFKESQKRMFSTAYSFYLGATDSLRGFSDPLESRDLQESLDDKALVKPASIFDGIKLDPEQYRPHHYAQITCALTEALSNRQSKKRFKNMTELARQYLEFIQSMTSDIILLPEHEENLKKARTLKITCKDRTINGLDSIIPKYIATDTTVNKKLTWDSIGGYSKVKAECQDIAFAIEHYEEIKRRTENPIEKGFLFYGPSGTGKTTLAKIIAQETGACFMPLDCMTIASIYKDGSVEHIKKFFSEVFRKASSGKYPAVMVYFDEIDAIASKRGDHHEDNKVVNTLLTIIDGKEITTEAPLFYVASTNRPDMLDTALTREGRLTRHIDIGCPSQEDRQDIFRVIMEQKARYTLENNGESALFSNPDYRKLAANTDGFTGARIKNFIDVVVSEQTIALIKKHKSLKAAPKEPLTGEYLMKELMKYKEERQKV